MAKRDTFEFTVTIHGTRHATKKVLEAFVDDLENRCIEESMGGKFPNCSMTISGLHKIREPKVNLAKQVERFGADSLLPPEPLR